MEHHHHGKGFEQANKEYFSSNIAEFEKPQNLELAKRFGLFHYHKD
jgi:hypothetical protein